MKNPIHRPTLQLIKSRDPLTSLVDADPHKSVLVQLPRIRIRIGLATWIRIRLNPHLCTKSVQISGLSPLPNMSRTLCWLSYSLSGVFSRYLRKKSFNQGVQSRAKTREYPIKEDYWTGCLFTSTILDQSFSQRRAIKSKY